MWLIRHKTIYLFIYLFTYLLTYLSERLLMEIADRMADDGYRDVGYQYITIDDCWLANERDQQGRLQPDGRRFPHGMKALADYVSNIDKYN